VISILLMSGENVDGEELIRKARETLREFEDLTFELRDYEKKRGEIGRMYSTGQIGREVYDKLMMELRAKTLPLVEKYFRLKTSLIELLGQLKVALTRLQVESRTRRLPIGSMLERGQYVKQLMDRVGGAVESVERALKTIKVERELRLLETVLDELHDNRRMIEEWRGAIKSTLDKWSNERFSYASRIEELEKRMDELQDSLRELEVRYMVGEYDRVDYESRRAGIEREMGDIQAQLEDIQARLEDLDLIAARCRELMGEAP